MRNIFKSIIAIIAVLTALILFLVKDGFQSVTLLPFEIQPHSATTWSDVLSHPSDVMVTVIPTGVILGDRMMLTDPKDPNLDKVNNRYDQSIAYAYLIEHSERPAILIDAGLSETFAKEGNYNLPMRLMLSMLDVHANNISNHHP